MKKYDLEQAQHREIARSFVKDIASSLQQFGLNMYINIQDEDYYEDLAWGGLTGTTYYDVLSTKRKNRVLIEQTSRDTNGNYRSPKGGDTGC